MKCKQCNSDNIKLKIKGTHYLIQCNQCNTKYHIAKDSINIKEWEQKGLVQNQSAPKANPFF